MCAHTYAHAHMHMRMHAYIHMHTHTLTHVHAHTHTHTCARTHAHTRAHTLFLQYFESGHISSPLPPTPQRSQELSLSLPLSQQPYLTQCLQQKETPVLLLESHIFLNAGEVEREKQVEKVLRRKTFSEGCLRYVTHESLGMRLVCHHHAGNASGMSCMYAASTSQNLTSKMSSRKF